VFAQYTHRSSLVLIAVMAGFSAAPQPPADERHVTVVAVLATDKNKQIDPRVAGIAEEVQKLEPGLTGFRVVRSTNKPITLGKRDTFPLVDNETLTVLLQPTDAKDGQERIRLTVKAPLAGEITYSCCTAKFFPIMTRYLTRDNERLIVAIMVKPAKK
jgi:hypothetical protein